ncbi:MAG: tetratricopeptide repeat protein [Cyanobacteriota bacterium]
MLWQEILASVEKALGLEHPTTATSLNNLAGLQLAQTNIPHAEPCLQRLTHAQANWLSRELPLQSRDLRSSPESRQIAEQVVGIDRLLASASLPPAQRQPLRQQRQQLEGQLYRLVPALRIKGVTNIEVAAPLKAAAHHGLLFEIQKDRPYAKGAKGQGDWGPPRYKALLLRPDGSIPSLSLGPAEPIDAAIAEAVDASADTARQAEAFQRQAALSRQLLKPLQSERAGVTEMFVSSDGKLNRLPFVALPMAAASGPTRGESVRLRLLTTGQELVRLQQPAQAAASTLITNPECGPASTTAKGPRAPQLTCGISVPGSSFRAPMPRRRACPPAAVPYPAHRHPRFFLTEPSA